MTRTDKDLAFGVAGELELYAREGRPSAVTSVRIYHWYEGDDADPEDAIDGAPAVDANPNTTTDEAISASSPNRRRIPVTATTGAIAGRIIRLVGADQVLEDLEIEDVDAGDAIIVRQTIRNAYASGSSVVSTRMTAQVKVAWCSDEANLDSSSGPNPMYRARWEYVVDGKTRIAETYFNLVRYPATHGVLPADVDDAMPGWLRRLPTEHIRDQGRRLIETAHRSVRIDLHGRGMDDAAIAAADIMDELVVYKTIAESEWARYVAAAGEVAAEFHEAAQRRYQTRFDSLVGFAAKAAQRDLDATAAAPGPQTRLSLTRR